MPVTYRPPAYKPLPRFPKPTSVVDEIVTPTAVPAAVPSQDQAAPVVSSPKSAVDEIITPSTSPASPVVETAAAGPGPTNPPTTTPVDPSTPGASGQDAWEIDPIVGGGTQDVMFNQYTTKYERPNPQYNMDVTYKLYQPPPYLNDIEKQRWNEINEEIKAFMAPENYDQLPKSPDIGGGSGYVQESLIQDTIAKWQQEQRNIVKTKSTSGGQPPPETSAGGTTVPESGTGGTPGQEATGGTTPPPTGGTAGEPPVTQSTPFTEGELTKTAQQKYDDFIKTSPADHPGGITGWQEERNALREAAKAESATATPAGSTAIGADDTIQSDAITGAVYEPFLKKLIEDGYELSPEEEESIRREYAQVTQKALSSLSGRGLGRGSEAVSAELQGAFAATGAVGEAKARARKEGTEAALKAAELIQNAQNLNLNKTIADRNYQLAVAGHNLADLKNSQDVSFQDRAMQLKTMESKAAIAQMEKEFGLKIDELEWKKFIETGELDAKLLDITGTQRLNEIKIVNDYWLGKSDLELQERLGIDKIELQKWMAGEEFDIARGSQALERMFKEMDFDIDRAKIEAALRSAGSDGWEIALGILSLGANILG